MRNNSKDSTTTAKVVCAMLFLVFIFFYVYSFQHNLLEMIQFAWSEGKTHYDRVIGASIITVIMALVSLVVYILTSLPQRLFSLVFFPAMVFTGLMTAVNVNGKSVTTSMGWLIATPVMLILYCCVMNMAKRFQPFLTPLRNTSFLSHPWWINTLLLTAMMALTYAMGNTDRTLHTRLAVEGFCKERQWDKALQQGFPQYDNDSSLTMLRALALANKGELGERLFQYEITGGSRALFPQPDNSSCFLLSHGYKIWQTIGIVPRIQSEPVADILKRELRRNTVKPIAKDYLLCAYLLDRNIDEFTRTLPKYYAIDEKLPQHYREALVLCKKDTTFHDTAMEADYSDFVTIMRNNRNAVIRNSALRDSYFGTYWYYYHATTTKER